MTDNIAANARRITVISHDAAGASADLVREFLADAEVPDDVSLTVNLYRGAAAFEVSKWDTDRCSSCGQALDRDELPGAVTVFDQFGNRNGEYGFQHGCGADNPPSAALTWVTADYALSDLHDALQGILTELDGKVEAHLGKLRTEWLARGARELAGVQAELDTITDTEKREEFLSEYGGPTGDYISVIWEADRLGAEVYVPTLSENAEPVWVYA